MASKKHLSLKDPFPQTTASNLTRPFVNFMHMEASGGIVLLICTMIALLFANSDFYPAYYKFFKMEIGLQFGPIEIKETLSHWINDGLMAIFFFVVGLEIKREMLFGELKDPKAAMLPAIAAIGGMVVPASIYVLVLGSAEGLSGWGIPMATDIAFVVGFLSLLGSRVPHGLKIFILTLAIVDDIGAILVIAVFYSSNISYEALMAGAGGLGFIFALNKMGVRQIPIYVFVGSLVWLAFLYSGVHATVAGVLLGLLTPASAFVGDKAFREVLGDYWQKLSATQTGTPSRDEINHIVRAASESVSPLERLELSLHPWVAFFIMPVFALANAAVPIDPSAFSSPVALAVAAGLFLGKPIGVVLAAWIAVKFLGGSLPKNANWMSVLGGGFMCGIGFTMSIFIASLALKGDLLVDGKVGTLMGSAASAILGLTFLYLFLPKENALKDAH
jgi:Na+:H+ antiporter, NhaA family